MVKKPVVTVMYGKVKLKEGRDYTVTYNKKARKIGTYKLKVKGIGKYTGTKTLTFRIIPKGTVFTKRTGGNRQITLTWKERKNITGYQIEYSLKKDFSGSKKILVNKPKIVTKVNREHFSELLENSGLDSVVTPKEIVAQQIARYVRAMNNSIGSSMETLYRLADGEVVPVPPVVPVEVHAVLADYAVAPDAAAGPDRREAPYRRVAVDVRVVADRDVVLDDAVVPDEDVLADPDVLAEDHVSTPS